VDAQVAGRVDCRKVRACEPRAVQIRATVLTRSGPRVLLQRLATEDGQDNAATDDRLSAHDCFSFAGRYELTTSPPFIVPNAQVWGVLADPQTRFMWAYEQGPARGIQAFGITPGTGILVPSAYFTVLDPYYIAGWAEDHSGKYIFTGYQVGNPNNGESPGVASWPVSGNGDLLTQTIFKTKNPIGSVAVARQNPN
jgi:hypothetical protein